MIMNEEVGTQLQQHDKTTHTLACAALWHMLPKPFSLKLQEHFHLQQAKCHSA
jgi:hypothetical protein